MSFIPPIDTIDFCVEAPMVIATSANSVEEARPLESEVKGITSDFLEKVNREFQKLVDDNPARVAIHHLQSRLRGAVLDEALTDLVVHFVTVKRFDEAYEALGEIKKTKARLACMTKMIVEEVLQDDYFALLKTINLIENPDKKDKKTHFAARCYLSEKTAKNIEKATALHDKIHSEKLRISLMKELAEAQSQIEKSQPPKKENQSEFDVDGAVNFINACETKLEKGEAAAAIFKVLIEQKDMMAAYQLVDRFSAIKDDCLNVFGRCLVGAYEWAEAEKVISLMTDDSDKKSDLIEFLNSHKCMAAFFKNNLPECLSYLDLLDEYFSDTLQSIFDALLKQDKLAQAYTFIDKLKSEYQPLAMVELGMSLVSSKRVEEAMQVLDKIPDGTPDRDELVTQIQEAFD